MIVHAGLIARRVGGFWRGVLIEGPSGAGKSDLAVRCMAQGFRLVADDRVLLWVSEGRLFGRSPPCLSGLIEMRGLQVVDAPVLPLAHVALIARAGVPERIPQPGFHAMLGLSVPQINVDLREASAPAKLSRALDLFDEASKRRT